jgi:hypothetical protein
LVRRIAARTPIRASATASTCAARWSSRCDAPTAAFGASARLARASDHVIRLFEAIVKFHCKFSGLAGFPQRGTLRWSEVQQPGNKRRTFLLEHSEKGRRRTAPPCLSRAPRSPKWGMRVSLTRPLAGNLCRSLLVRVSGFAQRREKSAFV